MKKHCQKKNTNTFHVNIFYDFILLFLPIVAIAVSLYEHLLFVYNKAVRNGFCLCAVVHVTQL